MKTRNRIRSRVMIFSAALLLMGVTLSSCDKDDDDVNNSSYTISGNGAGTQVVPAVAGNGSSTISGTYDPNTRVFNYTSTYSNLSGAPTSGGFYNGASGSAGTAVGSPFVFGTGLTGTGSYSGSMTLTDAEASQLTSGGWYYSYGTAANSGGEVRGQISATR